MRDDQRRGQPSRPGFLLPFGHRHSLLGSSFSRWGVGPSLRSAYRSLLPEAGPHRGSTFHTYELRPGWVPSRPRGRRCSHGWLRISSRRLPHPSGNVPTPRCCFHLPRFDVTRHHRGFTCVHPSGLPLACSPRMERGPLGFSPELRTPPLPATHVRVGTGLEHWPGTTQSTSSVDPPFCESTRNVRPRVALLSRRSVLGRVREIADSALIPERRPRPHRRTQIIQFCGAPASPRRCRDIG